MPLHIQQVYPIGEPPALGTECRFAIAGGAATAVEFFLEQDGILYPRPLPTEPDGTVRIFPESSGSYVLHAAWQDTDGNRQCVQTALAIGARANGYEPRQVAVDDGGKLWVPTEWDGRALAAHERPVLRALQHIVKPGGVAYDIGANVGLFATSLARLVGDAGWLYAFEPNPVCVSYLRANLVKAGARRFTIMPIAVSDRRGECRFTVNYASTFIGATADAPATVAKPGHAISVDADRLDAFVADWRLRPPDFIKIDIEGAEQIAINGMTATIASYRPAILVELHGRGPAAHTLTALDAHGYEYSTPGNASTFRSAGELLDWMPEACIQVIARPLPKRNG